MDIEPPQHTDRVNACAVSPDGSFIVSASGDKTLKVWDAATGRERATLKGHTDYVSACAVSPDGSFIVSASGDNTVKVWDAATGRERATLEGHGGPVRVCAVGPDGSFIISASDDKTLKVWDAATGRERAVLPLPGGLTCVALHPRSPLAVCGDEGGALYFIDLVGIEYGPIIVTAVDLDAGPILHCPGCLGQLPLQDGWLGKVIDCPQPSCDGRLRVNPFIAGPPQRWRRPRWQFWRRG